jgi:hypothetical protein
MMPIGLIPTKSRLTGRCTVDLALALLNSSSSGNRARSRSCVGSLAKALDSLGLDSPPVDSSRSIPKPELGTLLRVSSPWPPPRS